MNMERKWNTGFGLFFLQLACVSKISAQQSGVYYFTNAVPISPTSENLSNAVAAQCPADHPQSCYGISQPDL